MRMPKSSQRQTELISKRILVFPQMQTPTRQAIMITYHFIFVLRPLLLLYLQPQV